MGRSFLISVILYLKIFINRVESCVFKEVIGVVDNKRNFNNNLENYDRDQLFKCR